MPDERNLPMNPMPDDSIPAAARALAAAPDAAPVVEVPRVRVGTLEQPGWGRFSLAWSDAGLVMLGLPDRAPGEHVGRLAARGVIVDGTSEVPGKFRTALEAYLAGETASIEALPVAQPGTAFQRGVWDAMRRIPLGQRVTYGAIARMLGAPAATRAVGNACGANLVAIAVPCHRVLGGRGGIGGFAAGVGWKRRLLEHEVRVAARRGDA